MCPERAPSYRGFALPSAIFILVVLAALAGFIATIGSTQHMGAALDVQGTRAYWGARAGLEWGLYQVLKAPTNNCSTTGGEIAVDAASLAGIAVTVRCQPLVVDELGSVPLYDIRVWACNRPAATSPMCPGLATEPGYVERQFSAVVKK